MRDVAVACQACARDVRGILKLSRDVKTLGVRET